MFSLSSCSQFPLSVRCRRQDHVAVKIVKSEDRYSEAAIDEISLLEKVRCLLCPLQLRSMIVHV